MIPPQLTIGIPTFANPQQLRWCLESMFLHTEFPYNVVVVNNDPTGNRVVDAVCAPFATDRLKVIHADANLGWMGAHNLVIEKVKTPLYCTLNDDVLFLPQNKEFWRTLTAHFTTPEVGAVGPCSNFVSGCQNLFALQIPAVVETSLLIGFCMVVRTDAVKNVGGWDESLPGGDDLDLSIRLNDAGYVLVSDRCAYLHHIGQQTGRRVHGNAWDSQDHQERSNNAIIAKHGVRKWYKCWTAGWNPRSLTIYHEEVERPWFEGKIQALGSSAKGINIGCGQRKFGNSFGLDERRPGDTGWGGEKFNAATNDMTADAADLPVTDGSVDYIIGAHILEHLIDPLSALEEWRRIVKPGGSLLMALPDHRAIPTMLVDATHLHAYTPQSMAVLLHRTGWDVVEMKDHMNGAFVVEARNREG